MWKRCVTKTRPAFLRERLHPFFKFHGIRKVKMSSRQTKTDVILIGAGIMSATLGTLLKELAPDWNITVFEKLGAAGEERSDEVNTAGTGPAELDRVNYQSEAA